MRSSVGVERRVHEPGRDGDVADPEGLEVQRRRPVDAHVRDVAAGTHELGAGLERRRDAHCLDRHVGTQAVGQRQHLP